MNSDSTDKVRTVVQDRHRHASSGDEEEEPASVGSNLHKAAQILSLTPFTPVSSAESSSLQHPQPLPGRPALSTGRKQSHFPRAKNTSVPKQKNGIVQR